MPIEKNQYGLKRTIPASVKREVRQRSKFGCVICRSAIYQYEHILPEFKDAREHNPDYIALLCPTCHAGVTKKRIPKAVVQKHYEKIQNEVSAAPPLDGEYFVNHYKHLRVDIGKSQFAEHRAIINIDGIDVLSYNKDECSGCYVVTGKFFDAKGNKLFEIIENEWIGPTDTWDVEQEGTRLTIRSGSRNILFDALKNEKSATLKINRLNMYVPPFRVVVDQGRIIVRQYAVDNSCAVDVEVDGDFQYGDCSIYLDSSETKTPELGEVRIVGGKGVWIEGTGIWFGFGNQGALLRKVAVWNNGCKLKPRKKITKSIIPSSDQNYFVMGALETRIKKHPKWDEEQYFLNGHKLESRPFSWGVIRTDGEETIELFHISRHEPEDFAVNSGFVGFYADDVLKQEWSDKVFEVEILCEGEEGYSCTRRVKISDIGENIVTERFNPQTQKPFHPQEFEGVTPWKGDSR